MDLRPLAAAVLLALPASARAADSDFESRLSVLRAEMSAAILALKPGPLPTPAQARARLKAKLAGSGAPDSYVDAVLDDPRARLYPDIPGRFGGTGPAPAEPPYDQYRKYFMTEARIAQGAQFVRDHAALVKEVEARTGVDGVLLVALSGVETFYGTRVGTYSVLDALWTIVLKVPSRSAWALNEAAEFLKMTRAQAMDAHAVPGSYAGAFGYVQFEPSSYNRFAVDFDGDGRKRLDEWPDALGSAAHYLTLSGYRRGDAFAPGSSIGRSLFSYNHSDNYVRVILELRAEILKRLP